MRSETSSRRGRFIASAAAALLLAGGITSIGIGLHAEPPGSEGTGTASSAAPAALPTAATTSPASESAGPAPTALPPAASPDGALSASVPVSVEVSSVGISSTLLQLGKQPNGEVETPPGEPGSPAGWYKDSPSPGQRGSAVILGHVNSTKSPVGVFYRLRELSAGQTITVTRSDHTAAVFTVDTVRTYHKSSFPTVEVYQNADRPEIRLITCGGYDQATGQYLDNTVVFAHLVSSHPA